MNGEDYPDSIPMRIIGWSIDVKWSNGKEEAKANILKNYKELRQWIDKCPEHDNELLHSDDNGIVMVIRFNNEKEEE